ncbi:eukaryotic translation initiation factor 3 subunit G-domain-containing protein [Pisolithus tinctorius]|nr:eukaryotic translation initiation factor 3 subunit G-domain-containing protein [Pisolithus tinctorius]
MAFMATQKTSWADDVDELDQPNIIEDYVDENGIPVTVECTISDEGKKVRPIVEHAVAERKKWAKFGKQRGNKKGPDHATTTVGENVTLKITAGNEIQRSIRAELVKAGGGKVSCRLRKGDYFTAKCPYKDHLAWLEISAPGLGAGEPGTSRDEFPTLRKTSELFGAFGRVIRVYVGRDRETGIGKGFAFVSFEVWMSAQNAMGKLNGKGYDNLILSVQWSHECVESGLAIQFVCGARDIVVHVTDRPAVLIAESHG